MIVPAVLVGVDADGLDLHLDRRVRDVLLVVHDLARELVELAGHLGEEVPNIEPDLRVRGVDLERHRLGEADRSGDYQGEEARQQGARRTHGAVSFRVLCSWGEVEKAESAWYQSAR